MSYPRVGIIILNWNGIADTVECLESVKKITYPKYDVVLVDNGSTGDDAEVLKEKYGDYIHLLCNSENLGFAGGVDVGLRYAMGTIHPAYFLLLNNDTVVAPDFLDELVKVAESDETIGIVGPRIYYYDYRGENNILWFAGGKILVWHPWIYHPIGEGQSGSTSISKK